MDLSILQTLQKTRVPCVPRVPNNNEPGETIACEDHARDTTGNSKVSHRVPWPDGTQNGTYGTQSEVPSCPIHDPVNKPLKQYVTSDGTRGTRGTREKTNVGVVTIANRYDVTLADLQTAAGPDWEEISDNPETIEALAVMVRDQKLRQAGRVPPGWSVIVECRACGPVWMFPGTGKRLDGCPWCFNRVDGLSIPRAKGFGRDQQGGDDHAA